MITLVAFCYLSVGCFIAGVYAGAFGKISLAEKAGIVFLWLPGIFYAIGYSMGKQNRQQEQTP